MKNKLLAILQFIANPRLLLCFGLAWMITNGWSYVLLAVGTWLGVRWMQVVAGAYLTFLWIPATPEKLITIPLSILLLWLLFPEDQKTLAVLRQMLAAAKDKLKKKTKEDEDGL